MTTTRAPSPSPGTALATSQKKPAAEIAELITSDKARSYIEPFLPEGTNIQRVAATVMLAIARDDTGKLRLCTGQSLVLGVAKIASWRLELGNTAHLIPFRNEKKSEAAKREDKDAPDVYEAVPVADYKGLAELMIASRAVRYLETREVRAGDRFEYEMGLEPRLVHQPTARRAATITHVYCIVHLPFGRKAFEVMTAEEVDAIRQQYSKQWKKGPLPAWYAKKTIIRQVAKTLPKDPALSRFFNIIEEDAELESGNDAPTAALESDVEDGQCAADGGGDGFGAGEEFLDDRDLDDERRR